MTSYSDLFRVFGRIGLLSFGGPAAQIALMHRELVEDRDWLDEKSFAAGLSFCMLLPGPEAMQLATYTGWRLRGTFGGLLAGTLFVLPGAVVIAVLTAIYVAFGAVPLVQATFVGVQAAVLAIVFGALVKLTKRAFKLPVHWALATLSFVALYALNLPFPLVIFTAGALGWLVTKGDTDKAITKPPTHGLRTPLIWLALWWGPILALGLVTSWGLLFDIALFFSKLATVTFGGAYAVLTFMGQQVVTEFGWLTPEQMIDGLGLAETTPGPLILVTQFVGGLAGMQSGGWALGAAAMAVTLWATFIPCFLWIFTGAPYVAWLSEQARLQGALQAITAAVVGVIANLSLWFALHVVFGDISRKAWGWWPAWDTVQLVPLALTVLSCVLLFGTRSGVALTLAISAGAAIALSLVGVI